MSDRNLFDQANSEWDAGNHKQAFKLFMEAAEDGEIKAFNSLGYFYDNGIGVPKSLERALFWYKKAAKHGDIIACSNIGILYKEQKNFGRARYWLLKAINSGDGDAALEMAKLYLSFKSARSLLEAQKYLNEAMKSKSITDESLSEVNALLIKLQSTLKN